MSSVCAEYLSVTGSVIGSTGGGGNSVFFLEGVFWELTFSAMEISAINNTTNIREIKEYVEYQHKNVSETFDKLDTRLIGVIGFSGILLKLSDGLQASGTLTTLLKLGCSILFVVSVGCCLWGLFPRKIEGENPRVLRENNEFYRVDTSNPERCIQKISDSMMLTTEQMRKAADEKANCLSGAVSCLAIGSIFIGFNVIIETLIEYP